MIPADRGLTLFIGAVAAATVAAYAILPIGRAGLLRPGDPLGHALGILGSLLMLIGLTFPLVKRTRLSFLKMRWNGVHMALGAAGAALVTVHMAGHLGKPPTLLWLTAVGLVVLGAYGRLLSGRFVHAQFVSNPYAFMPARADETAAIGGLVAEKERLLERLEPGAPEGVFSLGLHHWARRPVLAMRYARLAWREDRLVRAHADRRRGPHHLLQRWWRVLHLVLACLLLVGLVAHVVTVLFFAGYAAEGGEIYWWHLRA